MPIRPENRARYPKDWPQIRAAILERAEHKCEKCKAPNRTRIARGAGDDEGTYMLDSADVYCAETGEHLGQTHMSNYEVLRMTDVVLTIAHLDHVPENCARRTCAPGASGATCDMTPHTMRQRPRRLADQGGQWRTSLMRFNAM